MITRTRAAALLSTAALGLSVVAGPGIAVAEDDGPVFVEQATYFLCDGPTLVTNVNEAIGSGSTPTWGTEAPTGGNEEACGTASSNITGDSGVWEGTFTGNLDSMRIELHQLAPQNALYGDIAINVTLWIDGQVARSALIADPFTSQSASGASYQVDLGVKDLGIVDDEEGPGTEEHTIRLEVSPNFTDSGSVVGWVWGAVDIPAGITFNGSTNGVSRF